jgi:hypothetical protein
MNRTDIANRKFVYNFCSIHFPVVRVLIIANPSEKRSKVSLRPEVRGFDGTCYRKRKNNCHFNVRIQEQKNKVQLTIKKVGKKRRKKKR